MSYWKYGEPQTSGDFMDAIKMERIRQDKEHPWNYMDFIPKGEPLQIGLFLNGMGVEWCCNDFLLGLRATNDGKRTDGVKESAFTILLEEVMELFTAKSYNERREEAIQVAAVALRIAESLGTSALVV